jgi:upstream activation factor subunit UAF30
MAKRSTRKSSRKTTRKATRKTARKTARKATRKTARKGARKSSGRRPNAAFMRPVTPSETLAPVVGDKPIPRTEITKRLWAYIKRKGLQDTQNKRTINADETLRPVFGGRSSVNMFEMTRLVNKHLS